MIEKTKVFDCTRIICACPAANDGIAARRAQRRTQRVQNQTMVGFLWWVFSAQLVLPRRNKERTTAVDMSQGSPCCTHIHYCPRIQTP